MGLMGQIGACCRSKFNALTRGALAIFVCTVLASCFTPRVVSQVEVFHTLPPSYLGETIAIMAATEEQADSLEFRAYADKLRVQLQAVGFEVVEVKDAPRYVAFLHYAIGDGQQVTSTYSIPEYGVTGYSSSTTYGTVSSYGGIGSYSGTTYYTPQYGITGYSTGVTTSTHYPRVVAVDIYDVDWSDTENAERVYEMMVRSSGTCGAISQVIDEMLEAGFMAFPGESGSSRKEEVTSVANC